MVLVTKKILWEDVCPIVLFWTITPEIAKLNEFLHLFADLTYMQTLELIWRMIQPEDLLQVNAPEVQPVYDCICCSPQLMLAQTKMRHDDNSFLLRERYTSIKTDIATSLEYSEYYVTSSRMRILITRLLQLSSPELVEELFQHYDDIWRNWTNWQDYDHRCSRYVVVMPTMISAEERNVLRVALYEDDDRRNRDMLSMHDTLVHEIMNCRSDDINQLKHNIELQLIDLQKVLTDHLL